MTAQVFFPCLNHSLQKFHIALVFQVGQCDFVKVLINKTKRSLHGHAVVSKFLIREDLAFLCFFEVEQHLDNFVAVRFVSLAVLLTKVLAQRRLDVGCINQLHISFAAFLLAVGYYPDVCAYACIVKVVFGHGYDSLQHVVLDDVLAQVACSASCITRKK